MNVANKEDERGRHSVGLRVCVPVSVTVCDFDCDWGAMAVFRTPDDFGNSYSLCLPCLDYKNCRRYYDSETPYQDNFSKTTTNVALLFSHSTKIV